MGNNLRGWKINSIMVILMILVLAVIQETLTNFIGIDMSGYEVWQVVAYNMVFMFSGGVLLYVICEVLND